MCDSGVVLFGAKGFVIILFYFYCQQAMLVHVMVVVWLVCIITLMKREYLVKHATIIKPRTRVVQISTSVVPAPHLVNVMSLRTTLHGKSVNLVRESFEDGIMNYVILKKIWWNNDFHSVHILPLLTEVMHIYWIGYSCWGLVFVSNTVKNFKYINAMFSLHILMYSF